ncbi:MAG TPA: DNA translocase FtsK 4TM domain-containing protein, partial [Thermoanaerobaculia bacterium]|nr:DNA translocase FtsK 4TM domain-containing protein [Thermoanaerobaculia bacterium]
MKSRRGGEMIGIIVLACGIIVGASLATYHPGDSSAFYTSMTGEVSNAIGYYGATLAWVLVGFFGFGCLVFPAAMLIAGWNRFWGREIEYVHTKLFGLLVIIVSLPPVLSLLFDKVWYREALLSSGGYVGEEIMKAASANLNEVGAGIVFVTALLVGVLLATRISLAAIFLRIREWLMTAGQAWSIRWARFTERRRKEQMKTSVVRKHLDRAGESKVRKPELRLVDEDSEGIVAGGLIVREVAGHGRFQIRRVTKADLRKAAAELGSGIDPSELYDEPKTGRKSPPEFFDFEDPFDELAVSLLARRRQQPPAPPSRKVADVPKARPVPRRLTSEKLPSLDLLTEGPQQGAINEEVHRKFLEIGRLIEARCREFSVEGEVTAYHPGPVVTTFEFKPSAGVKYARVVNLGDDLALALKAESIRIERISGSSTVGIEVPNKVRELITLRDIIDTEHFDKSPSLMTLALGKDIHGEAIVTDLARMPHLLVAGATGAGKSVGLNSMIVSLLYKALPTQLRMLMIDPKMVELKIYEDIPHLLHPIVTDPKLASHALLWAVQEMENRYRTLSECGVRNIDQYNALLKDPEAHRRARKAAPEDQTPVPQPLEYIVIIIDEFADLMMIASKDVEDSVTRLAQKARAVGIHLIIATQRPSVDVITGVIKANFPSRISYQVASKIDSRTILDAQGAEKLLGNGDMLFLPPGTARIRRIHGAYVTESEIADIVDFVKKNQGDPEYREEITKAVEEKSGVDGIEYLEDPKYDDAVRVVLSTGQASASYLQRRLKLGYSRAARLIEIMEAHGVVGPSQGSKPREILIRSDDYPS